MPQTIPLIRSEHACRVSLEKDIHIISLNSWIFDKLFLIVKLEIDKTINKIKVYAEYLIRNKKN